MLNQQAKIPPRNVSTSNKAIFQAIYRFNTKSTSKDPPRNVSTSTKAIQCSWHNLMNYRCQSDTSLNQC